MHFCFNRKNYIIVIIRFFGASFTAYRHFDRLPNMLCFHSLAHAYRIDRARNMIDLLTQIRNLCFQHMIEKYMSTNSEVKKTDYIKHTFEQNTDFLIPVKKHRGKNFLAWHLQSKQSYLYYV